MEEILKSSYDQFGFDWDFCGSSVKVMRDEGFRYDDDALESFKVIASSIQLQDGDIVCRTPTDSNGRQRKVISWQYHGNNEEEILMAVEHGRV